MASRIVYGQRDLDAALKDGIKSVTLCAGIYDIPITGEVVFDRLGPVIVSVGGTRREAEAAGMVFLDIYPEYLGGYATEYRAPMDTVAAVSSGSFNGSYAGMGSGYGSFSGMGGSFGSLGGLYSSLGGSFGSLGGSFGSLGGSFGSFGGSFGSFGGSFSSIAAGDNAPGGETVILGYGISLI